MHHPRLFAVALALLAVPAIAQDADLILHNGRIVTVDPAFSIHQALAVRDGTILRVGSDADILQSKGEGTTILDLKGKTVLPGLIDSHVHANGAAMHEFDHAIPAMESIADVLAYIRTRAKVLPEGQWIAVRQVFITRLKEQRYPTRAELDAAAPKHPVLYATGPDASVNTLALTLSQIDRDFKVTDGGTGHAEKDAKTGEPTGILRNCTRYVKVQASDGRKPTEADHLERLAQLFSDYNSVGLTGVVDRNASPAHLERFQKLRDGNKLTVRVAASHAIEANAPIEDVRKAIRKVADHPLRKPDPMLRVVGIKIFLDGGMLTGSAYMRQPWGVSTVYAIDDPKYRGLLFVPPEKLRAMVRTAVESGLQFAAHTVGDGAVDTLVDAYGTVNETTPVKPTRPCITHSNFMSAEVVAKMPRLGVVADIQPAWLYLDTRTLTAQFGTDRLRWFQPLKSLFAAGAIVGGGSDHMQKIGAMQAVNPYDPFLGMWVTIARKAKWYDGSLHPEEALTREQAIRFYTINNAYLMFLEDRIGSLEAGKLADFVVIDRDLLSCPVDEIRDTKVLRTYLNGKLVYERK